MTSSEIRNPIMVIDAAPRFSKPFSLFPTGESLRNATGSPLTRTIFSVCIFFFFLPHLNLPFLCSLFPFSPVLRNVESKYFRTIGVGTTVRELRAPTDDIFSCAPTFLNKYTRGDYANTNIGEAINSA